MAIELPRWAVWTTLFLWTQTADLGSFMATCSNCWPWQFHGQFSALTAILSSNCRPWQFYGRFSAFCPLHRGWNVLKLPTLAVLWPLFSPVTGNCRPWQFYGRFSALTSLSSSNCRPWQFYGRFSALTKSGHETADLGSFMAAVMKLQTLAVLWPLFSLDKNLL